MVVKIDVVLLPNRLATCDNDSIEIVVLSIDQTSKPINCQEIDKFHLIQPIKQNSCLAVLLSENWTKNLNPLWIFSVPIVVMKKQNFSKTKSFHGVQENDFSNSILLDETINPKIVVSSVVGLNFCSP